MPQSNPAFPQATPAAPAAMPNPAPAAQPFLSAQPMRATPAQAPLQTPAQPMQPATPAQPAQPAAQTAPAQPTQPAQPAQPGQPTPQTIRKEQLAKVPRGNNPNSSQATLLISELRDSMVIMKDL